VLEFGVEGFTGLHDLGIAVDRHQARWEVVGEVGFLVRVFENADSDGNVEAGAMSWRSMVRAMSGLPMVYILAWVVAPSNFFIQPPWSVVRKRMKPLVLSWAWTCCSKLSLD
jgi:hypothetical protein